MTTYNPDTQPFELALSNIAPGHEVERDSLIDVADTIDFAKRILLQCRVKNFTAADVIRVAEMIMERRHIIESRKGNVDADEIF